MENSRVILLYNEKALFFDGENIKSANFKDTKKYYTGALLPLKYIDTLTFKLPKTLSEEELSIHIEMKMYNEGGLDANKEYVIDFIKYDMGDNYIVEAFALSKDDFDEVFKKYIKKVSAIDIVFPRFLSYQALYQKELSKESNDLFIYLSEDEAFGAVYKKGEYIGYRIIDPLSQISKKVGVEVVKLKEYLSQKGLIRENYSLEETHIIDALQDLFLKNIEKIVYFINHKRSIFGLEGIDNIYIDFYGSELKGIKDFFVSFGYEDIDIKRLECCNVKDTEINLYIVCQYLYQVANEEKRQKINLTYLERRKPIYQYLVFKYTLALLFFALLGLGTYGYFYYKDSELQDIISQKESRLKRLKNESAQLLKKLKELKDKNQKIKVNIKNIEHDIFVYETTIKMIPLIEKQKLKREKFMNDVVFALAKYKLNTKYIKQKNSKDMEISLISEFYQRDKIAKFIDRLLKENYKDVYTKKIGYENGIYKSIVKVQR